MMQSAAFRYHTGMEMVAVNAPWPADGPPDPLIGQIYSNQAYFQWYYRYDDEKGAPVRFEGVEQSIDALVGHFKEYGPFDGILGFSQGAAMTTLLTDKLLQDQSIANKPKFALLIGGIQPMEIFAPKVSFSPNTFIEQFSNLNISLSSLDTIEHSKLAYYWQQ